MRDLKTCRINDFDDIFYATKNSQGYTNAALAIKYVLFNDETVFEGREHEKNKYVYISSSKNARKKAMIMQDDDLGQIMVKYCMASFGLRNKNFIIMEEEFLRYRRTIDTLELSPYEMIEAVAYAAMGNAYLAYEFLFANKKLLSSVVDYMLEERYISDLKIALDEFNGIINTDEIDTDVKYAFYDAYIHIDDAFEEIKRNDEDYVK